MSVEQELEELAGMVSRKVLGNLRVMIGEFQIAAKHFGTVVAPAAEFIQKLESGEWIVIKNPANTKEDNDTSDKAL